MIRKSSGFRPNPRAAPPPKFIPELWIHKINKAVYDKMLSKFPNAILNWEGEILHQGDMVWFPDPHMGAEFHHHGLITDRALLLTFAINDPIHVQSDLRLVKIFADLVSDDVIGHFSLPNRPALFAGKATRIEHLTSSFGAHDLRVLFVYGWRSLNPIRMATGIIASCQGQGYGHNRTIRELERFF